MSEACDAFTLHQTNLSINENCDWSYGLLHWYENIMTGAECQHKCRNVNGAQ